MTLPSNTSLPPRPDRKVWFRRLTTGLALSFLALCGLVVLLVPPVGARPANAPAYALGTSVVISEFRFRGSAGGNDEFVEIFNPTQDPIDISNWQLAGSNNAGGIGIRATVPAGTLLAPGQFFLFTNNNATNPYDDGVPGDVNYSTGITDDGGVAILNNASVVIDQVGLSIGSAYKEGTALPSLGTTNLDRGYVRNPNGTDGVCHDNNNNQFDFREINPSDPQNSSSPISLCPAPTETPTPTNTPEWQRRIIISEVAWGGTQADDTLAQWIELYNPGDDLDLTGLYLSIPGKSDIFLSGTLLSNSYYLIERNEADTSAPANLVVAFPFLNPAGDSLLLYAPGGNLIDSANADGGPWPAGSRFFSYTSMERIGPPYSGDTDAAWLNFFGTPYALDRLSNLINGSPGGPNSVGATSTPTLTPTPTSTATVTPTRTITPTPGVSMAIVINEVAWGGTAANSNHEWIELYNPGTTDINITGWRLATSDNSLSITLNGTISAGGYFLLERSTDSVISDIAADQVYTGSQITLNNDGRVLRLLSPSSQVIDTANGNGGAWPAGSGSPSYCSMERRAVGGAPMQDSDFSWITNTGVLKNGKDANDNDICGTPKNINWAFYVTPTPTPQKTAPPPTRTRTPTPNRATPEPIVINEFLPHARSDYNGDGVIDSGDQFIELINLGSAAVTLNNYRLDDQQGDSTPFTITGVTLQPGTRMAFFSSETGILLSNGGDSVRLFKSNGQIADAFTYGVLKELDRSWCRYPDGRFTVAGQSNWTFGCLPSPGNPNELATTERIGMEELPLICRSPRLPFGIYLSECDRLGLWNWNSADPPPLLLLPWLEADGMLFIFE